MTPSADPVLLAAPPVEVVVERLQAIRTRIKDAGGDPEAVRVVAVTKGFDQSAIRAAIEAGMTDVGENYPQELLSKASAADSPGVTLHMIGAIQRRRIKALATVVDCWQTVSRSEEISSLAELAPGVAVFIQVDTTGRPDRNGCSPADAPRLVSTAGEAGLRVRGLMTIGPGPQVPETETVSAFETVAGLARDLDLGEISMGMTEDLQPAVAAGTTMLRVGRALFGPRTNAQGY
ncbi:MAG: YggS family pyridoxal phosphate enzyme [Acidimicrobiales bacterium]